MRTTSKALVCGLLEDNGRALFLKRIDKNKKETLELPCFSHFSGDPIKQLAEDFLRQTGIDAEVRETAFETRHNAGSRRRKQWVPCLVFRMRAKSMSAKPSSEFAGYKWLSLNDAKKLRLARNAEWILLLR